ncbi:MAG TPA: hypothetical protein VMY35_07530, partial [Phycisphaerae bacterium]|nr:hypothetical protein [Phycisphaerae bacterium]
MDEPFYKASRAMLARTDLTLAEKLVRIVRAHWLAFEGREPTAAETARATGLSERQIYRILARKKGAFNAEDAEAAEKAKAGLGEKRRGRLTGCQAKPLTGCHDKMSVKTDKMSVPGPDACSKSYGVMRDVDKERGMITAPSPSAARGQKKEETDGLAEAAAKAGEQGGMFAMLALKGRAGGGKWPLARWIGQAEEDEAARRFSRADLEAFVASRTSITEAPWLLAGAVRRHAQAAKQAAFRERLRTIRVEG